MKSTISYFKILAGASCVLAMAACDSVKDVKETPVGVPPAQTVVLSGEVNGLSSLRSITLMNNGDAINAKSFINAAPTVANQGVRPVPFSFGAVAVGTAYNITVKQQPELKNCVVVNGTGTLSTTVRPDIVVNCSNVTTAGTGAGKRSDLTVNLPSDPTFFTGLQGAKVRVTTEEEIVEKTVTSGATTVTFPGVLINATGSINAAPWSVTASTFEGNTLNKCVVTFPTGSNSTATVTTPVVGAVPTVAPPGVQPVNATAPACQFAVAGKVGYSLPAGTTAMPTITGLKLQLRDMQATVLQEITIPDCTVPISGDVTTSTSSVTLGATVPVPTNGCAYNFTTPIRSSTTSGLYEVAVSQQPTGQFCIVVNGGSVSVFTQGTTAPVPVTNANVFCRAVPATASNQLQGVFRLQSSTYIQNVLTGTTPQTSTWLPFDLTKWNTASSNMMAFFPNGTFLYGTHMSSSQVEHGFYDYDSTAHKLRFTLIVDTNNSLVFPTTFNPTPNVPAGSFFTQITQTLTTTPGISALPNPIRQNGTTLNFATAQAAMTGVTIGTVASGLGSNVKTISGTFGNDPAGSNPANTSTVSWTLQEVPQVDHEMTGGWVTQDSRRLWVWDYRTYYGTGVGVLGGSPSMNDACFTIDDLHESSGIYTRRGSGTGCYPASRPATGQTPGYFASPTESVDLTIAGPSGAAIIPTLPGYTGRIPGGEPAPGTSSPSPIYFQVAPAATFASVASATYFPNPSTSWCTTEILGLRASANGFPINPPVYFCRTRAN